MIRSERYEHAVSLRDERAGQRYQPTDVARAILDRGVER